MNNADAPLTIKAPFNPEIEKQERFLKAVAQRAIDFKEDLIKYLSKGDGPVTRIGTLLSGVGRKNNDTTLAVLTKNWMTASALFSPLIDNALAKKIMHEVSAWVKSGQTAAYAAPVVAPSLMKDFSCSAEYVAPELAEQINAYVDEKVELSEKITAKDANYILEFNKGGFAPYASNILELRDLYNQNAITAAESLPIIQKLTLENNGISFSAEHNTHAISAKKLEELRTSFKAETKAQTDLGDKVVYVFRGATQVKEIVPHTNNLSSRFGDEVSLKSKLLATVRPVNLAAPAPAPAAFA